MPNYSSKLYNFLALAAAFLTFIVSVDFFYDSLAPFFVTILVFFIYNWFGAVLYGLEENGKILQEISKKLGKDLSDELVDDGVKFLDDEENIEDDSEKEEKIFTQKEEIKEENNTKYEHWLEKKEISKKGIFIAISLPLALLIYVIFFLIF